MISRVIHRSIIACMWRDKGYSEYAMSFLFSAQAQRGSISRKTCQ